MTDPKSTPQPAITPLRCDRPGCDWTHHGIPDGRSWTATARERETCQHLAEAYPEPESAVTAPAADVLRAAAVRLRALLAAPGLTPGPWTSIDHGDRLISTGPDAEGDHPRYVIDEPINPATSAYIATMGPPVAAALTPWLEDLAEEYAGMAWCSGCQQHAPCAHLRPTLAVARAVLWSGTTAVDPTGTPGHGSPETTFVRPRDSRSGDSGGRGSDQGSDDLCEPTGDAALADEQHQQMAIAFATLTEEQRQQLGTAVATVSATIRHLIDATAALQCGRSANRPAWQSPYGPAPRRR